MALTTIPKDIMRMFPLVTLFSSPFDRRIVAKGGPPIPVMPCSNPLMIPVIINTYLVIVDFNLHPLAISNTKKMTNMDIIILMICSSIETKKIVPIGMVMIIEKNIGEISLNLHVLEPTYVK
jgi:hypothetical protein